MTPKFWKLVKKDGFLRTYIRPHQTSRHPHYAGGHAGTVKCVGQDEFGNRYYEDFDVTCIIFFKKLENDSLFFFYFSDRFSKRWVEYSDYFLSIGKTGDSVPPRWHGWMAQVYDDPPSVNTPPPPPPSKKKMF